LWSNSTNYSWCGVIEYDHLRQAGRDDTLSAFLRFALNHLNHLKPRTSVRINSRRSLISAFDSCLHALNAAQPQSSAK
jgi:hypothetical protein